VDSLPEIQSEMDEVFASVLAMDWSNVLEHQKYVQARRASHAAAVAEVIVAELVTFPPTRPDSDLEDALCTRLGERLLECADGPLAACLNPNELAEATLTSAALAVRSALEKLTPEPDGWRAPWRVLTTAARIVALSFSEMAADAIEHLRGLPGGSVLPRTPVDPTLRGQVLWMRDAYGSRFGVAAAFSTLNGPDRWYLWDIDACGHRALTVHSAYYQTPEQALAAWQGGVGLTAAGGTAFAPVDDPSLLRGLMPYEEGFLREGSGDNAGQLAEYHRSRRLAKAVIKEVGQGRKEPAFLNAVSAATEFTAWLRARRAGLPQRHDLDELVTDLAESWCLESPAEVYSTCSPHRVAHVVLHLCNYYQDDYADDLIALLPDWTSWLAARNGTASHLAERCRPYALGEPHADVGSDDSRPNYMARVIE
jgi:hypothetical protein